MKIKIEGIGWDNFEKEYDNEAINDLACVFEYIYQYKMELGHKLVGTYNPLKREIILTKINHIEKTLEKYKDMTLYLMEDVNSL